VREECARTARFANDTNRIDMKRKSIELHCRCVMWVIALLCVIGGAARGQNDDGTKPEPADDPKVASVVGSEPARMTLDELKAAGALRSSYLKQQRHSVDTEAPQARLAAFRKDVEPVLKKACVECHGSETQEGNIRLDTLDPDLLHGDDVNWWLEVVAVLSNGEMPPADATKLADKDRSNMIEWLSSEIQVASTVRRAAQGHSSFRRMTRYEYKYALQDLLGLPYDFAKDLPPESTSEDGFQNSSEILHMSAMQFGTYRDLSRTALKKATVRGERPTPIYWSVSMKAAAVELWAKQDEELEKIRRRHKDEPEKLKRELERRIAQFRDPPNSAHYRNLNTGRAGRATWSYGEAKYAWKPTKTRPQTPPASDHVAVIPAGQKLIVELGNLVPDQGTLRVRVRASRTSVEDDRNPSLQLEFGWQASNDSAASVRISDHDVAIDAAPGNPQFYQWDIPLSEIYPRNLVRKTTKMGETPSPSEFVKLVNSSVSQGDIQIDYVEITAPVYDKWPPDSHTRIFIDSPNKADEATAAHDVLTRFMSRAWRRPITPSEVNQKLALFTRIRPACDDFQGAMIEVLATVLSSPKFLYLNRSDEPNRTKENRNIERLADSELASRLSVFLWCSTPDEELLELAANGRLGDREVVMSQVTRMLADSRSRRFSEHFVRQWLGMQLLDFLNVDRKTYPQFDPSLKEAMQEEPVAFFHEVLQNNHSVLDFIHADYTMANERLASHYGLSDVQGNHFRRVQLELQHRRGGLLTQAGLLAMNSDGTDSHPLKRGIWLLESLLNDPPPPPPPAVPEIDLADPEIAKLTLKQRIENHRNHAACMSCHQKIDPWGIAFENFDAVGSWRTQIKGKPVDASSLLFNGQKLDGMDGLKRFLLEYRQDQFARAMVHKMTTFALGRPLTFGDRSSVDRITADVRKQGDGLATMVKLIVASDLFQSK
jgi:mono/diheme cytochrome c family protein